MSSPPPEPADGGAVGAPVAAVPGTRRRAGNAMGRARAGILDGARRCLAERGPKGLTMSAVADRGGVAKATVYNHFRSRGELVTALAVDTVAELLAVGEAASDAAGALAKVGTAAAALPEVRGAVRHDPTVAGVLTQPGEGAAWDAARAAAAALLDAHGLTSDEAGTAVLLRWVAAVAVAGPPEAQIAAEAQRVVAGLAGPMPRP